jgi:hypothetical protein
MGGIRSPAPAGGVGVQIVIRALVAMRSEAFLSNGMDQQEADDKHHRAGYAMN